MFKLDERLDKDTFFISDVPLCRVLLMNDNQFPWLILVPRVADVAEIIDLDEAQQQQFLKESGFVSHVLKQKTQCDKLNVAALGNMVKQLHIHHVARFTHDVAWPKPVWGNQPACPYHIEKASVLISTYRESLALFY